MSYTFNGFEIINTEKDETYDIHIPSDMENLTQKLNTLTTYKEAIRIDTSLYGQGLNDADLTKDYRDKLRIKIEALTDVLDKAKLLQQQENLKYDE